MHKDSIVEEVRRVKQERAKRYNYNIRAMARALRAAQRRSKRKVLTLTPRWPSGAAN